MVWDAFIVGEDWISEHYFTTDAKSQSFQAEVLTLRKQWTDDEKDGLESPRGRFASIRGALAAQLATLDEEQDASGEVKGSTRDRMRTDIYGPLRAALGYETGGFELAITGPLTDVSSPHLQDAASLVIIEARPAADIETLLQKDAETLLEKFVPADDVNHPITSVARLLSRVFITDNSPQFALVLAGRWMLVAERERWPEGRYLAINLQLIVDRNDTSRGGEMDRAVACVSSTSLTPDAEGTTWWARVLEASVKHTVGVSKDLREGVRQSIEIIANDVVERRAQKGLPPLPAAEAEPLAKQALRYLYRILFLLYAEASPELEVLPVGASQYEEGYSLDRLRELVLVTIEHDVDASHRTHFYDSLAVLFRLVDQGSPASIAAHDDLPEGLTFNSLRADLFHPRAVAHIDEVGLSDVALQRVLAHLLLSKERRGADRGFISYAELGINQLGAVYEGLMSYTGFFAEENLHEVAKGGDASKGSWVVPASRSDGIDPADFVLLEDPVTGEKKPALHEAGSFVFRLAGRERQQSASYYTPEVLTKFVVSQALAELLDQAGETTPAADILTLTVCEPALGSGAFAIEAVRQLAEQYLARRQKELGEAIDPDQYPKELQKVKASIALHQVYGVDLNATAVELAEISLWLDTMVAGLDAPWFGLHLRRGNSLIGARRAVYSRDQITNKSWLGSVPRDVPVTDLAENIESGRLAHGTAGAIHHFLLPAAGWGATVDAREVRELAPESLAKLKTWRRSILARPSKRQIDQLVNLAYRVETLWQFALRRLTIGEQEARRAILVWGGVGGSAGLGTTDSPVSREEIERKLGDPNGAFQRLRRVMDAWNAMWFWPLTAAIPDGVAPPTLDEWIGGLQALLGHHVEGVKKSGKGSGSESLALPSGWHALGDAEELDLAFAGAATSVTELVKSTPWLGVAEHVSARQGFFHWELDFATVLGGGGFDLQLGNPPWVRPRVDVEALLAEGDPWWQLKARSTAKENADHRAFALSIEGIADLVVEGTSEVTAIAAFLGSAEQYPHLVGLQPDLYRCFMEQTWRHATPAGSIGLIHPESHFTDQRAGVLRAAAYQRLRRHWAFVNELVLFEVDHHVSYGVHVYGTSQPTNFVQATSLYHPDTVERSFKHDGLGPEPGLKDDAGNWDVRAHLSRIQSVDSGTLSTWHAILESDEVPPSQSRMVYAVNRSTAKVLDKLAAAPRIGELEPSFSAGWHETNDRAKGYFDVEWGSPSAWKRVILQGPHIHVGNPAYKTPNQTMLHNQDWTGVDLETLPPTALPATVYKPRGAESTYDDGYVRWETDNGPSSARAHYRVSWRNMAANTGERTLIPAIIPPGAAHVDGIYSLGLPGRNRTLALVAASMGSLVSDFSVRAAPKSTIRSGTAIRMPKGFGGALDGELLSRILRLNCLTDAYADLWTECFGTPWSTQTPLRIAGERRQAMLEIDVLVAIALRVSADELCAIYRTGFPVLAGYDRNVYLYDANKRLVPNSVLSVWRAKGNKITESERQAVHPGSGITYTYELPFVTLDREADMRQAYAHFEQILKERS